MINIKQAESFFKPMTFDEKAEYLEKERLPSLQLPPSILDIKKFRKGFGSLNDKIKFLKEKYEKL